MPRDKTRLIKLISLNFIKSTRAKTPATFPHLDQRGKACGSSFSAYTLLIFRCNFADVLSGLVAGTVERFAHASFIERWKFVAGFLILLCSIATIVNAEPTVDQQIDQAIHQHLQTLMNKQAAEKNWRGMRLVLVNTPLTSTNKLTPCPTKIKVSGGNATKLSREQLTLECSGMKGWPIKVSSDMQVFLPVVTSTAVINRGETIQSNQLQTQVTDIAKTQRGFYHRISDITGMGAKRRIRANQILSPDLIDQPQLIKRGEKIKIIANRDGISASMPGEALEKGGEGEVIRVKNLSSGKTIEAKVIEAGVVTSTF